MFNDLTDNKIKNIIISFEKEIKDMNMTINDIENREQNFLYIGDRITDKIYNDVEIEYIYSEIMQKDEKMTYKEFCEDDEDNFDLIWWRLLDIVENYIAIIISENKNY